MVRKKTDTEFKKEVCDLVGDEYTFLDKYVNTHTKIRVKHNKCGNTYEVAPGNFFRGVRCPYCAMKIKTKTDEQFKDEINNLVGDEYTFLDTYVNNMTKLRVKHSKCGNVYKVTPNNFLRGKRCPYCVGLAKKTDTQFKQEVYDLVGDEYKFLDSYVNNRAKLRVKHNKCGNVYRVRPYSFLQGSRCPYCSANTKKTDIQFKHEVKNLVGDEYTFLDTYVGGQVKLRVKHNKCGNTYRVTPSNFISHHNRCPYCSGCVKKTNEQFKKEVYDLVGRDYVFLEPYVNAKTKIRVKHSKCGNIYKIAPIKFIRGNRCPYCNNESKTKTNIQFKQEVYNLVGDEYLFLDTYVNDGTKLRVKHIRCGNVYEVTPSHFIQGERCPYCNIPKGEDTINKILKSLGVNYEYQKTFDDLRDVQPLSYDFYIPDQNVLIEYQGRQHYQAVDYFGGDAQFKVQQEHDKMKADYAKNHNYNLIAVPYTEDTFSKIKKYLIKHGLKQKKH